MKLPSSRGICQLIALLGLGAWLNTSQAQTVAEIAGSWHGYSFSTPNLVTLSKDVQGRVTNIQPLTMFETDTENITITSDGSFSGSASGSFSVPSAGTVVASVTSPDPGTTTFRINRSNDVMVAVEDGTGSQNMIFLMKAPGSVTTSEMGGNWTIYSFTTPAFFSIDRADSGLPNVVTHLQGGNNFGLRTGNLTINGANGSITGTLENGFTGQYQNYDSGNGLVNVTITPSGESGFNLPLFINQSKDVMLGYQTSATSEDNRMELLIFIKAPASTPTAASYKGTWRLTTFDTPSALNQVTDGQGHLTELNNRDAFAVDNTQRFTVGSDAFLTGHLDTPVIGSVSVPAAGQLSVSVTHPDNSNDGATFSVNAGQNFLIAAQVNGYNQELIIGMRGPQGTGTTKQMGLLFFNGSLYWAADSTRKLQTTTDLTGGWSDVANTMNTHTFAPPGGGTMFFRIAE